MTVVLRVSPQDVTHKLSCDLFETEAAEWGDKTYMPIEQTIKHRSIVARYVEGRAWEETELFTNIYTRRFAAGEHVRGCSTMAGLLQQYRTRVDHMYADMQKHGYRDDADDLIPVVIAPDGTLTLGNQGNHRLAIAKVLNIPKIAVRVCGRLDSIRCPVEPATFQPVLHDGAREIPAMTTPAERVAYYELAKAQAALGAVVELGTWLGAATVFMAAGVRDADTRRPMHSYDRFKWKPIHEYKAGHPLRCSMIEQVKRNLGPLAALVQLHKIEITDAKWLGGPIGLLVADGPKHAGDVVRTLGIFGPELVVGSCTAWQDFAYFPAYELPVCFERLEQAGVVSFVRGVFPGTTAVLRIEKHISRKLAHSIKVSDIKTTEILPIWEKWSARLPEEMRPRFMCGAALFLHDRGEQAQAAALFKALLAEYTEDIASKWEYFKNKKPEMLRRYPAIAAELS
jgi:hypothetical protein